jgi:flavin-dependent dehydrogenase
MNWLAVRDAAMAFDPLSSQGIVKAFDHAFRAGSSIAAHFAGDAHALQRLASALEAEYAAYRATQARYYKIETRWRAVLAAASRLIGCLHSLSGDALSSCRERASIRRRPA